MNKTLRLLALLMTASIGTQATGSNLTMEATGERMTYFYRSPSEKEFEFIQRGMHQNLDEFQKNENGVDTLAAVFLARVHEKHGWPLLDLGHLDDDARSIVTQSQAPLARYVQDDTQINPGKLDVWWVSFFATADTRYLDNILGQVGDLDSQYGAAKILLIGAANWSVSANCRQHSVVLQHVKSVAAREPAVENRKMLLELISKAERPDD